MTELTRYLPGHWQTDVQAATTSFFHTNMLGTTRMLTDDSGAMIPEASRLYTAFGDLVTPPTSAMTRYGYAGAWGYEGGPSLWGSSTYAPDFVHVGARYYSPTLGRFLQRDPIGISGGLNVYEYVRNNPTWLVDPEGAYPRGALEMQGIYKGLRMQGYTPVEASEAMADMAEVEAKIAGAMVGGIAGGVVAVTCARAAWPVARPAVRSFLRWLNRGKLRIGKTGPKNGKYYFGIRWKNKHLWDIFEL